MNNSRLTRFLVHQKGTSSVEYAVILGVVVLVVFTAIQGLANETIMMWEDVADQSSKAISAH